MRVAIGNVHRSDWFGVCGWVVMVSTGRPRQIKAQVRGAPFARECRDHGVGELDLRRFKVCLRQPVSKLYREGPRGDEKKKDKGDGVDVDLEEHGAVLVDDDRGPCVWECADSRSFSFDDGVDESLSSDDDVWVKQWWVGLEGLANDGLRVLPPAGPRGCQGYARSCQRRSR